MWLQPNTSAAWAAQFIPATGERHNRPRHHHHLTGTATNLQRSQPARAMICANPTPARAHGGQSLPASSSSSVGSWGTKQLQIGHPPPLQTTRAGSSDPIPATASLPLGSTFCVCCKAHMARTYVPGGKPQGTEKNRVAQRGRYQTIQPDTNELLTRPPGAGQHHMSCLTSACDMGTRAERAKPHLPTLSPWL